MKGMQKEKKQRQPVMITGVLSDVRIKYHVAPGEIGHGHYGVVRECTNRETGARLAIKSINKSKVTKLDLLGREIAILKEVHHPNIIELVDTQEDAKYLHIITELCTGGELFDRIIEKTQSDEGHFTEKDAANIIRSALDAVGYCHAKGIAHRDLKPENFLFKTKANDAPIKIIDFGLSRYDAGEFGLMKTRVGTPYYVAPEVLRRGYTKSCDIWSIGIITYILLCGYPPFYGDTDREIFDSVASGEFDFPSEEWDGISNAAKDFISSLLQTDPNLRPSAGKALSHKWIVEKKDRPMRAFRHNSIRSSLFQSYLGMKKLKKAALMYLARQLKPADLEKIREIFTEIDVDGDGLLTLEKIDNALRSGSIAEDLQACLIDLRTEFQCTAKETLKWKDFLAAAMTKCIAIKDDNIRLAFDYFKKSDEEYLLMSDLVVIFGGESQANEVMGDVDTDGDGRISYEEFHRVMNESNRFICEF